MISVYFIFFGIFFGLVLGAVIVAFTISMRSRDLESTTDIQNIPERILPFIEVHQSLLTKRDEGTASAEQLKKKLEDFKERNQFYRL